MKNKNKKFNFEFLKKITGVEKRKKEQKKNKFKANFSFFITTVCFMMSLFFIVFGVYIFMAGFHNVDLSHNGIVLEAEKGINLIDTGSDYITRDLEEYYIMGHNQMLASIYFLSSGFFLTGLIFYDYLTQEKNRLEKKYRCKI